MEEKELKVGELINGELITEDIYNEFSNGRGEDYEDAPDPMISSAPNSGFSNSPMVVYTRWSSNYSSRGGRKIDTITIHHMAGNLSLETCGNIFAGASRNASATYAVDNEGRVGQYVDEKYAPWTTSSYANDSHAVTIEVANSYAGGNWPVSDTALNATIKLVADICKRNGIEKLNYTGDVSGNMTKHCWFDSTLCPGPYLGDKFKYIEEQVNLILNPPKPKPNPVIKFDRIWGTNRYETAKAAANAGNTGGKFDSCILVSGENFADALSSGFLHYRTGGPILLINNTDTVIDKVLTWVKTNVAKESMVYIVGGKGVIPESVETKLEGYEVTRFAGSNRYKTNISVLKSVEPEIGSEIIVCYGTSFADGICASIVNKPVMLVANKLIKEQLDWLKTVSIKKFYLIGGESVVSKEVEAELAKFGSIERVYGSNRYSTAVAIANKFFKNVNTVIMATGKSYADGLCSANLGRYPLLLVDNDTYKDAQKYVSGINIKKAYVMGGTGTITNETVNWVLTKI